MDNRIKRFAVETLTMVSHQVPNRLEFTVILMCRFISSRQSSLPVPSISQSLFASLIGNICSAAAFPLLLRLFGLILSAVMPSDSD
jgi:hypothetical protein